MNSTPAGPDPARDLSVDLLGWARYHTGEASTVTELERMPGHSGLTYGFTVTSADGHAAEMVMRVPPVGVRHQHNLDVVRLAPVLTQLHSAGIPVPRVIDADSDDRWFGTPFLIVEKLVGSPLPDVFDATSGPFPARHDTDDLFRQALHVLAHIHAVDPRPLLESGWSRPISVEEDLSAWEPLLERSEVPDEIVRTKELRARLSATAPTDNDITIVHGDFYSNNWLIDNGALHGVLDWENSALNRPMWDLGWIATIYDPECWGPSRGAMEWHPTGADLYAMYESAGLRSVSDSNWYQALMCYRLACITPSKVRLHRSGRRVDPIWEVFAEAVPYQLERAHTLLKERS